MNQYESSVITSSFEKFGYEIVPHTEPCDVCCINTCAVTEESTRKSRQIIRRMRSLNPESVIAAVGCMTQTSPDTLRPDEADIVLGTYAKSRLPEYVEEYRKTGKRIVAIEDVSKEKTFEKMTADKSERTRATVKIQDGCNNFCSYCIIPFARGRIRSKAEEEVVSEISSLMADGGYREVVLTGIHLDNYGKDSGTDMCTLLEKVDKIQGVERIRLGSLEPVFITEDNVKRFAKLNHLCPQYHLSLQSGCAETLRRMNRHYTPSQYAEAVALIRKYIPEASITTDVIVGFPGETEEEYKASEDFVRRMGFLKVHVFPYSERKGTVAASMDGKVPKNVKSRRVDSLSKAASVGAKEFMSAYVGAVVPVLFDREKKGFSAGYTPNYIDVRVIGVTGLTNTERNVEIVEICDDFAVGVLK